MSNPIKNMPLLDEEDHRFLMDTYTWLLRNFGGDIFYRQTSLILPTNAFFPELFDSREVTAETVFHYVQKYAGMKEWPCQLKALTDEPALKTTSSNTITQTPLGTFSAKESGKAIITYNPSLLLRPTQLVATFAHELAHYLTGGCTEPPPGGWENWEAVTDITTVFMGFGVFMTNSVFTFRECTDGESYGCCSSHSGYVSEEMLAFALGIFVKLKEIKPYTLYRYLEPAIKSLVVKSLNELNDSQDFSDLLTVKYLPSSP